MQLKDFTDYWKINAEDLTTFLGCQELDCKILSLIHVLWQRWQDQDENLHCQKLRVFYLEIVDRCLKNAPEPESPAYEQYIKFRAEQQNFAAYSVRGFIEYWGITREEFAEMIGRHPSTINRWYSKNSHVTPGSDIMKSLAMHHALLVSWWDEDQDLFCRSLRQFYATMQNRC